MSNIENFFSLLAACDAVSVDDGALLTSWEKSDQTGDPDNEVIRFDWTDGECQFSDVLTEGGIATGVFHDDGKFVVDNRDGETTVVRFFEVKPLMSTDESKTHA